MRNKGIKKSPSLFGYRQKISGLDFHLTLRTMRNIFIRMDMCSVGKGKEKK